VYVAGRVVHISSSTSYQDLTGGTAGGEALANQLHERLSQQHREVMAQLEAGTLQLNELAAAPVKVVAAALRSRRSKFGCSIPKYPGWKRGTRSLKSSCETKFQEMAIGGADVEAFFWKPIETFRAHSHTRRRERSTRL